MAAEKVICRQSGPLRAIGRIRGKRLVLLLPLLVLAALLLTGCVGEGTSSLPVKVELGTGDQATDAGTGVRLIIMLTVLSLAPAILMLLTAFTRIVIVLSFVRTAMGVPQLPPNQVLVGLSMLLTFFVMAPVWQTVNTTALQPYLKGEMAQNAALDRGLEPLREFMFKQTREKDLALFVKEAKMERPRNPGDVPTHVLVPAFVISELKTGFQMGFMLFIPFLVIDMIVSSTLLAMGMFMLPPVVISLPFKVLLFILVDGWHLIVGSLLSSFG